MKKTCLHQKQTGLFYAEFSTGSNGCASDSLRSLLSVLPSQASLGQKGTRIELGYSVS
jgi:hypothetical protein